MFQTLIDVILPVFIVIGSGYGATRAGYFNATHIDGLLRFTQQFAIPCLLFFAIANLDLSIGFDPRLMLSFYGGATASFVLGILAARTIFRRDWEDSIVVGFCCLFSNSVLLGLPITERAYGAASLTGNYAIIALHAPYCYGLGITVMEITRNTGKSARAFTTSILSAMFKNTLILGIVLGFLVNIFGLTLPQVVSDALSLISQAALPGALFALGGILVQHRPEGDLRLIALICFLSLIVHPALSWGLGVSLDLPQDLFRSSVLTAAMAPGFNAYIFANMYGRGKRIAASSVLLATGASVVTVWLWLNLLA